MTKLVLASDTHNSHRWVDNWPDGDVLVIAGDFTRTGTPGEIDEFARWVRDSKYPHAVVIAGNHDRLFEGERNRAEKILKKSSGDKITYLQDSGCEIDGISFYGTPWQPAFGYGWAFNLRSESELFDYWLRVPAGVDVLVTHSPPHGILDMTGMEENVGSVSLKSEVLKRIKPRVHVFGHIHPASGVIERNGTIFVNAAIVDDYHNTANPPRVVELQQN